MDLSLLIFSLETYRFCMKCIEFTTRTYNFKNLAVGSLIWSSKTGVNSSYFPQKSKIGRTKPTQECTHAARQNHKERAVEMNATTASTAGTCMHMKKEEDRATNERQSKQA